MNLIVGVSQTALNDFWHRLLVYEVKGNDSTELIFWELHLFILDVGSYLVVLRKLLLDLCVGVILGNAQGAKGAYGTEEAERQT